MKIVLTTHPGIILTDPKVELEYTVDFKASQTFSPMIALIDSVNASVRLGCLLPPQPYVNGTWTDEDVHTSIEKYVDSIAQE